MPRPRNLRPISVTVFGNDKDGWQGFLTVGLRPDGKPDRRKRRGKTREECERKIRELEDQLAAGKLGKPGRPATVQAWFETWLSTIANRPPRALKPRTLDDYWSKCRNWIFPHIGAVRLDALEADHLDRLYTTMYQAGMAQSHVAKVHAVIRRGLEIGVRRDKVARNVARLIGPPEQAKLKILPYSQTEAGRILEAAERRPNPLRWQLGLALGLRQGEALGLRWSDIDFEQLTIRIAWQVQRLTWAHGCADPHACGANRREKRGTKVNRHRMPCPGTGRPHGPNGTHTRAGKCPQPCPPDCTGHASGCPKRRLRGMVLGDPNDPLQPRLLAGGLLLVRPKDGERIVPLPEELVPALKAHRTAQKRARLEVGSLWHDHDLLFTQWNGNPIHPRRDWGEWKQLLADAGVRDGRVHDARHTAGTILLELGVDIRVVQEILGHSDLRMTQQYTQVTSALAKDAASRMGTALFGPAATSGATTRKIT